jgi:hypothetical protein
MAAQAKRQAGCFVSWCARTPHSGRGVGSGRWVQGTPGHLCTMKAPITMDQKFWMSSGVTGASHSMNCCVSWAMPDADPSSAWICAVAAVMAAVHAWPAYDVSSDAVITCAHSRRRSHHRNNRPTPEPLCVGSRAAARRVCTPTNTAAATGQKHMHHCAPVLFQPPPVPPPFLTPHLKVLHKVVLGQHGGRRRDGALHQAGVLQPEERRQRARVRAAEADPGGARRQAKVGSHDAVHRSQVLQRLRRRQVRQVGGGQVVEGLRQACRRPMRGTGSQHAQRAQTVSRAHGRARAEGSGRPREYSRRGGACSASSHRKTCAPRQPSTRRQPGQPGATCRRSSTSGWLARGATRAGHTPHNDTPHNDGPHTARATQRLQGATARTCACPHHTCALAENEKEHGTAGLPVTGVGPVLLLEGAVVLGVEVVHLHHTMHSRQLVSGNARRTGKQHGGAAQQGGSRGPQAGSSSRRQQHAHPVRPPGLQAL